MLCYRRTALCLRKQILVFVVGVSMLSMFVTMTLMYHIRDTETDDSDTFCRNFSVADNKKLIEKDGGKRFLVSWYNLSPYIKLRPKALQVDFTRCKYSNCELSLCKESAPFSDVVIFNGRRLPERYEFKRPAGQLWIFAEDETPYTYDYDGGKWKSDFWRSAFNWTMTYDKQTADIYMPNGEIWKKKQPDVRDFLQISKNKTREALLISSHCTTESKRTEYVKELRKYIDVDILGACGRNWNCGKQWVHDDCFEILNTTYKFYLSFENALCRGYRTEKFFENFNYDIILVARDGISNDDVREPMDTYISTANFPNVESLGKYLKKLSGDIDEYATILARKSQYYFPGFQKSYQTTLCDICEKLNHKEETHKEIPDLIEYVREFSKSCIEPKDIQTQSGLFDWMFGKW